MALCVTENGPNAPETVIFKRCNPQSPGDKVVPGFLRSLSVGYAVALAGAAGSVMADHFGVVIPEVGLKYVFSGRYHLGGELVSVPVLFNERSVVVHYRVALSFGVSF